MKVHHAKEDDSESEDSRAGSGQAELSKKPTPMATPEAQAQRLISMFIRNLKRNTAAGAQKRSSSD